MGTFHTAGAVMLGPPTGGWQGLGWSHRQFLWVWRLWPCYRTARVALSFFAQPRGVQPALTLTLAPVIEVTSVPFQMPAR